jgi:hypothetical protein
MTTFDEADRPVRDWDAAQVERDTGETREERDADLREHAAKAERTHWDENQMAEDSGTDNDREAVRQEPVKEGESALSGHGTNPGGGQRWAERDRSDRDPSDQG